MTTQAWRPETGDRVRVRDGVHDRDCEEAPHFLGESGCTGQVVRVQGLSSALSHPYLVMFDRPCAIETRHAGQFNLTARHYSADEMEPLEEP
jgi:hypothetical protein